MPRVGSRRTRMAMRPIVFFIFFLLIPIISKIYAEINLAGAPRPVQARLCPKGVSCHLIRGFSTVACVYIPGENPCQERLGFRFVSPLVSPARKLAPHPPSLFSPFSRETVPAQSSTDFLTHTLRLWQKKGAVPAALRRAFGRTPPRLGVT